MNPDLSREIPWLRPGQRVAERYRIEGALGAGGMGVVVAARHVDLDLPVAIKFLRPHLLGNPGAVRRFLREAQVLAKLRSQHTARVLDTAALDSGEPYIVMERLEGATLKTWLQGRGRLPIDQAVEIVVQACAGVSEAHGLGIIHRDLKPSNLFCCRRGDGGITVKVLDFGISKLTDRWALGASGETSDGATLGSPHYMSPEQMHSAANVDERSDIWALGVIAYELVSGRVPFAGTSLPEVAIGVTTRSPAPLGTSRPGVAPGLEQAIARCLEKDPGARHGSVIALAEALAPWLPAGAGALLGRLVRGGLRAELSSEPALSFLKPSPASMQPDTVSETDVVSGEGGTRGRRPVLTSATLMSLAAAGIAIAATMWVAPGSSGEPLQRGPAVSPVRVDTGPGLPAPPASVEISPAPPAASDPPAADPVAAPLATARRIPRRFKPRPEVRGPSLTARDGGAVEQTVPGPLRAPERAAPPRCDPPYSVDLNGNRVFIPECVE
jgi:serine/threonine-protein kinase